MDEGLSAQSAQFMKIERLNEFIFGIDTASYGETTDLPF